MAGLDPQQRAAVEAALGPLLIVAGAGTGKTKTLTHRVAHWVQRGLDPNRTLLVTFTQRAAREMSHRITRLNDGVQLPWVGTFHGVALRILRDYSSMFGYAPDFSVMDSARSHSLMNGVLKAAKMSDDVVTADALLRVHSLAVNADISLSANVRGQALLNRLGSEQLDVLLVEYLVAKIEQNCMDYDDLLIYWHQLTEDTHPSAHELQARFDAVFVDEYQDVNPLQVQLLDNLVQQHRCFTAVGDDRQSIYAFRGSDVRAMLRFETRYPAAQILELGTNYRSTPQIVALANLSIIPNQQRHHTALESARAAGSKPQSISFSTSREQAVFVCQQILGHHENGVPFQEQSILYRTHSQARALELALGEAGIPYVLRSGRRLFARPHVRPVHLLLQALTQPEVPTFWAPTLSLFHGLGTVAIDEITQLISSVGSLEEWLNSDALDQELSTRFRGAAKKARTLLLMFKALLASGTAAALEVIIMELMMPWIRNRYPDDADDRIADLWALVSVSEEFPSTKDFLDGMALSSDVEPSEDAVVLSTVHRAKGLEWAVVFVVGLFEGGFPLGSSFKNQLDMEEERRLFYVAITRCQRWLYLCHAWTETSDGMTQMPSRFLGEVAGGSAQLVETVSILDTDS
jgi:DNA helicase-2/ATP-dependent DNA helicase PcrA